MSRYTYAGDAPVLFSHYLDVTDPEHPKTLEAHPGETYEIKQAEGLTQIQPDGQFADAKLPMPPDDNWAEAKQPAAKKKEQADG
jgi:hypothetical protein